MKKLLPVKGKIYRNKQTQTHFLACDWGPPYKVVLFELVGPRRGMPYNPARMDAADWEEKDAVIEVVSG